MLNRVSRSCFCSAAAAAPTPLSPWLFVGLGNPGEKFKGTRHNVGFEMIDAFSESVGISMNIPLCKALFGEGFVGDVPVLLAKPQTYMNLSGESAGPLAAYYKLPLNRVIVFEECDQPFSREQRICSTKNWNWEASWPNGSQGFLAAEVQCNSSRTSKLTVPNFHNKVHLGLAYMYLLVIKFIHIFLVRIASSHSSWCCVLLLDKIDAALPEGVVALRCILHEGLAGAARWFNQEQKYKYMRSETMSA